MRKSNSVGAPYPNSLVRLAIFIVFSLLLHACGGGSNESVSNSPAVQTAAPVGNGEVLVSERFVLANGETRRFTQNTTILASNDITIGGQIALDPGVSLTLFALNQINVSGQIGPAPGVTARGTFEFLGRDIRGQGSSPSLLILASPGHNISGTIQGTGQQDIFIATFGADGGREVTISGRVTAGSGVDGTRFDNAGPGAKVHIGTTEANTAAGFTLAGLGTVAGDLSASLPSAEEFDAPDRLLIPGTLKGGEGGKGFTDTVGVIGVIDPETGDPVLQNAGEFREFVGGDGGPGGDLVLLSVSYQLSGTVQAGSGGAGGDCGVANGTDGTNGPGESVSCNTGDGGPGGKTTVLQPGVLDIAPADVVTKADGGVPGSSRVRAGNGAPGFGGGDIVITPGDPGLRGTVDPAIATENDFPPTRSCQIVLEGGGNGGAGTTQNPNAGSGGEVRINVPTSHTRFSTRDSIICQLEISIRNYANGGNGLDVCSLELDTFGGGGGLGGGNLIFSREAQAAPALTINTSFNGGDGGDGSIEPGAAGGFFGTINFPPMTVAEVLALATNSFQRGEDGEFCPMVEVTVDLDPGSSGNQLERNFEFDPQDTDPNCGVLEPLLIQSGAEALTYTLTPRTPQGAGPGITLSSTSGALDANSSTQIIPTFNCQAETTDFEHTFDLLVTSSNGVSSDSFVIVFRGTVTAAPPMDITGDFDIASASEAPFATLIDLVQSPTSTLEIAGFRITRADNPNADFDIVTGCASSIFLDNMGGGVAMDFDAQTVLNGECNWDNFVPLDKDVLIFLDIEPLFTTAVNQLVVQVLDVNGVLLGKITLPITKL